MNKLFYKIDPEVPGQLGKETKYDQSIMPWPITKLHVIFDGWLGGDLLKISSCFIVTKALMLELEKAKISGIEFENFKLEISDMFKELYPNKELPQFYWLKIKGEAGKDDFGKAPKNKLIVSQNALNILNHFNLSDSEIKLI
ncbi:MAG: hypothetical protein NVV82_22445 [Sporocytophaga sp.]|nr:hypothetical protein [Sporocytophaga sp.]